MTTTRLRAALDAIAAAVPDGRAMLEKDPADFLLEVRVRLATAADTESRLRDEIHDLRLQVQELTEDLEDARRHGCECGEEEACRYVRERDKARALADTYREELRLAEAEAARYREALERVSDVLTANGCDCECDHDVESHDDCERCVACRVSLALAGQDAGKEKE